METHEGAYHREELKTQKQDLEQRIARIEAGEPLQPGETLADLHAQYEQLESHLNDHTEELKEAA